MFVCHGNICRSPMAEFIMKDLVSKRGLADDFIIESSATSSEEIGHPVHYGTKKILNGLNIDCSMKRAKRLTYNDYNNFDYFIGMDEYNIINMRYYLGKTQMEIASSIGISQAQVSRLEKSALERMKKLM